VKAQFQGWGPVLVSEESQGASQKFGAENEAAHQRLLSVRYEPLFIADWERVLMMHFEVDAEELQRELPFELDLREGGAYVSLVAFTMRGMRPRFGGALAAWLTKPIATHHFLNVRTYVRHECEPGIYFMREWLPNRLSVVLGPWTFGLPYRLAEIDYSCEDGCEFRGKVRGVREGGELAFHAKGNSTKRFERCEPGSLSEWLMERYTAYASSRGKRRFFRVWHEPWLQKSAEVEFEDKKLLERNWSFFRGARFVGANFSPGTGNVLMGRPHSTRTAHLDSLPET